MLKTYFEISLGISAVIFLLLVFTPVLRKRYSASLRYGIWLFCAIALLIPYNGHFFTKIHIPQPEIRTSTVSVQETAAENTSVTVNIPVSSAETEYSKAEPAAEETPQKKAVDYYKILITVWLAGAALFMLYHIVTYAKFLRKIKPWCKSFEAKGYRGRPRLAVCRILKSPMLVGFVKPQILLPRADYSENELNMILSHELTHYKRGDLYAKLLFITANALHWFNPLVYAMRFAANRDMEYSCDELVVKNMDIASRRDYSMTILHCASGGIKTAFSTYFKEDKKNLKQRFSNILSGRKKRGIIIGCVICALVIVCAGIFAFSGTEDNDSADDLSASRDNYLFLGLDERGHIDAVMTVSMSPGKISAISIPRDSVPIDTYTDELNELNILKIENSLSKLLGIYINRYFAADIDEATSFLSLLGEVEFEIPDLYGDGTGMVYDDPYQDLHISLAPGRHSLSADEMMQVIRYKKSSANDSGEYMEYENGDADRITMTNSLLGEAVKQKMDIISDKNILQSVYSLASSAYTNMSTSDIEKIWRALHNRDIEFSIISGEYAKDANLNNYYVPDVFANNAAVSFSEPFIDAVDTVNLTCEVTSITIDGDEQISEVSGTHGIWYNERQKNFHICLRCQMKDGNYIIIQPGGNIIFENGSANGTFLLYVSTKEEAGETLFRENFEGEITGLYTEYPEIHSYDEKYAVKLHIVNEDD